MAELLDIEVRVNSSEGEASFDRMRASIARMEEALSTGRSDQLISATGRAAANLGRESSSAGRGVEQLAQSLNTAARGASSFEREAEKSARAATKLEQEIAKAGAQARGIGQAVPAVTALGSAITGLVTAAAGFVSIRQLFAAFGEADRAFEMARAFDLSTSKLILWNQTAKQFGADATDVQQAMRGVSQSVADALRDPGGQAAQRFRELKIDVDALRGVSIDEVLLRISDGLSQVDDAASRTGIAVDLLHVRNANLFSLLRGGRKEIEATIAELAKLGVISDEDAAAADRFGDSIGRTQLAITAMVLHAAPAFATLAEAIEGMTVKTANFLKELNEARNANAPRQQLETAAGKKIETQVEVIGEEQVEQLKTLLASLPQALAVRIEGMEDAEDLVAVLERIQKQGLGVRDLFGDLDTEFRENRQADAQRQRRQRIEALPPEAQVDVRQETQRRTQEFAQGLPPAERRQAATAASLGLDNKVDQQRARIEAEVLAEKEKQLEIEKAKSAKSPREAAIAERIIQLQAEEERLRVDRIAKLRLHGPETKPPPVPPPVPRAPIEQLLQLRPGRDEETRRRNQEILDERERPQNLPIDTHLTRDRRGEVTSTQIGEIQTDREREEARRKSAAALRPQEVEEQAGALTKLRDVISDLGTIASATKTRIDDLIVGMGSLVTSLLKLVQDLSRARPGVGGGDVTGEIVETVDLARAIGREVGDSVLPLVEAGQNVAGAGFREDQPTAEELRGVDQPIDLSRQSIFQLADAVQPGTEEASPLPQAQRLAERVAPLPPPAAQAPVALTTRSVRALGEEIRTEAEVAAAVPRPEAETRKLAEALRPAAQPEARAGIPAVVQRPAGPAVGPLQELRATAAGRERETGRVRESFGPAERAEQAATARSEQLGRELEPVVERLRAPLEGQVKPEAVQELPGILAPERPALPELPDLRLKPQKVQLEAPEVQLPPARRVPVEPERIRPALLREPPAPREAPPVVERPVARPVARPAEPAPPALERLRPAAQAPTVRDLPKPPAAPAQVERPRLLREPPEPPTPPARPEVAAREIVSQLRPVSRELSDVPRTIQRLGAPRPAPVTELGALLRREEPTGRLRPISARQFLETQPQLAPARTALPTATASAGPAAGASLRDRGAADILTLPIRAFLRPVREAVEAVAGPVGRAVSRPVQAVARVIRPVAEAVGAAAEPVSRALTAPIRALATVARPVVSAAATVARPVAEAVTAVARPVGRAVETVARPFVKDFETIGRGAAAPFRAVGRLFRDEAAPIGRAAGVPLQGPQTAAQAAGGFFGSTIAPAIKIISTALPVFSLITSFLGSISSGRQERRQREAQEFQRQVQEGGPQLVAIREREAAQQRRRETEQAAPPTPLLRPQRGPELAPLVATLRGAATIPAPEREREFATVAPGRAPEEPLRRAAAITSPAPEEPLRRSAAIASLAREEQPLKAADLIRQISNAARSEPAPTSQAQRTQAAEEIRRRDQFTQRQGNKIDLAITALDAKGVVDLFSSEKGRDARKYLAEFVGLGD